VRTRQESQRKQPTRALLNRAWLVLGLALPGVAHAAHPLISEDTATQGTGGFELEIGNAWTHDGSDRTYELGPQLSYGLLPNLDAILRPTWLDQRSLIDGETTRARGPGDTAVDLKWRFFQGAKLSFALRGGVSLPTGDADRGLGIGDPTWHGLLAATLDLSPVTVDANLGYTRNRGDPTQRRDLYHASAAAVWTVNPSWKVLVLELAADSNVDSISSEWPAVARVGVIYTVKKGLDLDIGYQARLNQVAPSAELLVGITFRWGP
jgi:Putative MetA-pathway of phenol degradation